MKVFIISTIALPCPPLTYGGIEQVVWDQADILNNLGHEVTVAAPFGSQLPEGVGFIESVSTGELGFHHENIAMIKYIQDPRLLESDIIHDHSHQKLLSHLLKENEEECFFTNTIHCTDTPIFPVIYPNICAISQDHADMLKTDFGYDSKVVYNGINVDMYEYKEEKGDHYIFLGRPAVHKGTLKAIEFCIDLNVPLDVVGGMLEGTPTLYAIGVAQHCKLGSPWKYWGAVTHRLKVELLSNAKALVFPFNREIWREPFGLVVPEALACGTPIVTWNQGVFKETVIHGKTGFLANDEEEFKEYMLRVDEIDPEDCRRDAEERWTRERMTEDYLKVYSSILDGERW